MINNPGYGEPGNVSRHYNGVGYMHSRPRKRRRWVALLVLLAAVLLLLILLHRPVLTLIGAALVTTDEPRQSDVIVVLMGGIPDRIVQGVELYEEGFAEFIVMVRSHDLNNYELAEALELEIPGAVDLNRDIALQLGVPQEHIIVLQGRADSTRDEALAVRDYLQANDLTSLLLVTSRYHSTRSKKTFEQVLGSDYEVTALPSPHDPFDPEQWWKERRQLRNVVLEYQKLVNLYLFRR